MGDQENGSHPPSPDFEADERRERAFADADRVMMQVIQTSLSLIGFGFTINTLFQSAVVRGLAPATDASARRLGVALLALGLGLLAMGICNQIRHLRVLAHRYGGGRRWFTSAYHYNTTPSVLTGILLWIVGLLALFTVLRYRA